MQPVPKVKNPRMLSEYRPISVVSVCSKILENIMNEQLNEHIRNEKLLSDNQAGFRKFHNTTSLLLKFTDDIRMALDKKEITSLLCLDFSRDSNLYHMKYY